MPYRKYRKTLPIDLSRPKDLRPDMVRGSFLVEDKKDGEKVVLRTHAVRRLPQADALHLVRTEFSLFALRTLALLRVRQ